MKSFLFSLLAFLFIASISFFLWNMMPDWAKLIAFGLILLSGFFLIKTFFSDVLGFIFSHFSQLFTVFATAAIIAAVGIWAYPHLFTKKNTTSEIQADALSIALGEMSTSSSAENNTRLMISDESISKEEMLEELEKNTQMGAEEKAYWKSSVALLNEAQLKELKKVLGSTAQEEIKPENTVAQKPMETANQTNANEPLATSVSASPSVSANPTFSYGATETGNWKKPVVIEPTQTATASLAPDKKSPLLVSAGVSDEKYSVAFEQSNAAMIFPKEYAVSSVVWSTNMKEEESVHFAVQTPEELRAFVTVTLQTTGENYERYSEQFKTPKNNENIFIMAEKKEKTITYVTFFNGVLWNIEISLPFVNAPQKQDFYSVLLPIIFEEKE